MHSYPCLPRLFGIQELRMRLQKTNAILLHRKLPVFDPEVLDEGYRKHQTLQWMAVIVEIEIILAWNSRSSTVSQAILSRLVMKGRL